MGFVSTVSAVLYYAAPLTPAGPEDDWVIDAVSQPPEVIWNFRKVAVKTPISDLRNETIDPKLDHMGFERILFPTQVDQQALADRVESSIEQYEAEIEALLKFRTGADSVVFFDATVRREDP